MVNEKVTTPKSKGGQELKKQTTEHRKYQFLNVQKNPFMLFCYY
jgi:hypothetical protein